MRLSIFALLAVLVVAQLGCQRSGGSTLVRDRADLSQEVDASPTPFLTAADVTAVVQAAAGSSDATTMVIAVTDREGQILAVFRKADAPVQVIGNFGASVNANDFAVSLARTGAFFSNDQAPLSSRTVRFISGIHFPPGITNRPNAALYGIENTNRGCPLTSPEIPAYNAGQDIAPSLSVAGGNCDSADQSGCGLGIATGKPNLQDSDATSVAPGGVPIFKDGRVVGGVGVTGVDPALSEFAALVGSIPDARFGPRPAPPGVVVLDGIQLPFVEQTTRPGGGPGVFAGAFVVGPIASPRGDAGVPDGWLIGPFASAELSAEDVETIVSQAVARANETRAAIRLPLGSTARMVIGVSDLNGTIIGLFRMRDSTIFSIDVAATKARNVVYFSSAGLLAGDLPGVPPNTAVTSRTISFGAQPLYPPGIDDPTDPDFSLGPGPFFDGSAPGTSALYANDVATPCQQGSDTPDLHQSGIVFFPGSTALYRGFQMVGGLGVSGDGVEQDDFVAAAGATGFAPPESIRADQITIRDVRLPFFKFPRNPESQ